MVKKAVLKTDEKTLPLTVSAPKGRRFRAGLEFGPAARAVTVSPEQAAAIQADPFLRVED